jgi:DNA-nicking Smr family endonuclease
MKGKGLGDLKQVWREAQRQRQLQQQRERESEAQRRAEAERAQREQALFRHHVGPVLPIRDPGVVDPAALRPAALKPEPTPRSRLQDEQAVLREALSDEFDVESLLQTDAELAYARPGVGPDVLRRLRRGEWTMQAELDLHGLRRDEARERLGGFIREAARHGLRCVRVVHGKGLGSPGREPVLKNKVRTWLVQKSEVMAFVQAKGPDGGAGALIVLLRPSVVERG